MNIDLTPILLDAAHQRASWSPTRLEHLLASIQSGHSSLHVEWDREAGTEWAHVFRNEEVLGVLHAVLPFGMFVEGVDDRIVDYVRSQGVFVTTAPAYDVPYYAIEPKTLPLIFPDSGLWPDHFPTTDLSIHDIYYATV